MVAARHSTDDIWFCYPGANAEYLNSAYVYNTVTEEWGHRALPDVSCVARGIVALDVNVIWDDDLESWDSDITTWNQAAYSATADGLLMADPDSTRLLSVDTQDTDAGEDVPALVERTGIDLSNWVLNKTLTCIYPQVIGQAGDVLSVRVGYQDNFNDPITWEPAVNFVIGTDHKVDCMIEGRYLAYRFESSGGKVWKLYRVIGEWTPAGRY